MIRSHGTIMPSIASSAFIAETAVIIGDVSIGPDSSIWYNCVVRGDINVIRIGARSNIQDLSMLHVSHGKETEKTWGSLVIGDDVTVGHNVVLHGCTLGNGCFVGMQAMVMDGAVVGEQAQVGAGSLVTPGTVIPPRTLWMGSPARFKRELTPVEIERLKLTAENYVLNARQFRTGG